MTFKRVAPQKRQSGAAALAVAMLLLFGMTLIAFFASRGMIFEQRTSANQFRSTRAFEMADAGLEWAVARLNAEQRLATDGTCSTTGTGTDLSYADRYLPILPGPVFSPQPTRSGCSVNANGTLGCVCPLIGNTPAFGNDDRPRFSVQLVGTADPTTIEVISTGCTNQGSPCDAVASPPDAVAVVRALYKMKPTFPNAPGAGLVTGSAAVSGGNLNVINMDVESNGVTINAGTTVALGGGTSVVTLPGTPPRASVLDNDPSLAALTSKEDGENAFFAGFFGESIPQYKDNTKTYMILGTVGACAAYAGRCTECTTASSCGQAVSDAYTNKGFEKFWADTDVSWTTANTPATNADNPAGTLGTADRPIAIATSESIELKSNLVAYGMFYATTATAYENWDYSGSGTAQVFGAFVSRGDFNKGSGTLDLIYDPNIFKPDKIRGLMVRVPGSWRDKSSEF